MKKRSSLLKILIFSGKTLAFLAGFLIIVIIIAFALYLKTSSLINDLEINFPEDSGNNIDPTRSQAKMMIFESDVFMKSPYKKFVNIMNLEGNEKILDFGSGSGALSKQILKFLPEGNGQITCLDLSEVWLRIAQERLKTNYNVEFIHGDITKLDMQDSVFDIIAIHFVLHDIPKDIRSEVIESLTRILRPGGKLIIREPTAESHGMPAAEIISYMNKNKLREISAKSCKILFFVPVYEAIFEKEQTIN